MVGRILIVTEDPLHATFLEDCIKGINEGVFTSILTSSLATALKVLESGRIDVVLADLKLPDSRGRDTFDRLFKEAPNVPIIIFAEPDDEAHAIEALHRGAQRYLSKGRFGGTFIARLVRDIVARKVFEESLYIEKTRTEITLDSISDSVITTDMRGNVDHLNQAAEEMTGWTKEEARGRHISEIMTIINSVSHNPSLNPVEQVLLTGKPVALEGGNTVMRCRDCREIVIEEYVSPIHDSTGQLCGAVVVFHDISASKEMTARMAHLAQHDFLTDLPNRLLLQDRISQAIELAARRGTTLGVLFLDLDNFKPINDTLGHDVGDQLLRAVAQRLTACVRSSDTVSRSGGDEFILLVLGEDQTDHTATVANKILTALAEPLQVSGHKLQVTASIGVSLYPSHAKDAEPLIKKADIAMYEAKCRGGNNFQVYHRRMNRHLAGECAHDLKRHYP